MSEGAIQCVESRTRGFCELRSDAYRGGTLAMQHRMDLADISVTDQPVMRFKAIDIEKSYVTGLWVVKTP